MQHYLKIKEFPSTDFLETLQNAKMKIMSRSFFFFKDIFIKFVHQHTKEKLWLFIALHFA